MDVALSADDSNAEIAHGLLHPLKARLAQCVVPQPARLFLDALHHWDGQSPAPEGWHERRWQRACKMQLGVTPKLVQRLVRLHRSARQSLAPGAPHDPLFRWSDHALDAGYCDQAHLLKDYRELAGVAPRRDASAQGGSRLRVLQLGAGDLAPRVVGGTEVPTLSEISKTGGDLSLDNGVP
jgi:AraC-like DNA-binding protein